MEAVLRSEIDPPKAAWIDRCTMELGRLWPHFEPVDAAWVAYELWTERDGTTSPEAAAFHEIEMYR